MTISRKQGDMYVSEESALEGTGILEAGSLTAKTNTFSQSGGQIHSGPGGTHLTVREQASMTALKTTRALQGDIARRGRNFQIEPGFVAAKMTSLGNQTLEVTQGPFQGQGIDSEAAGINTLIAEKGTTIRDSQAAFELASTRGRCGPLHTQKTAQGGSSVSSIESRFVGGKGIEIVSKQDSITLINTLLISGGDATLKAKKLVEILNNTIETTTYGRKSGMKGFTHQRQTIQQSSTHVLPSRLFIQGNCRIEADQEIRLRALQGFVAGDMSLAALNVILEGAKETQTTTLKHKSVGLSFFGSEALEGLMQGRHSSAVLKSLLNEDSFLGAIGRLAKAQDKGEKLIGSVQTLMEGWCLATLVAEACDRKSPDGNDVLGALTDRWGLTTPIKDKNGNISGHEFNPKFTLSYSQSTSTQTQTRNISTALKIAGNISIVGDTVKLLDGTEISAENIQIQARKLLEIKAGQDTQTSDYHQNGGSVSFHADGSFAGASLNRGVHHSETVRYHNACLKARNVLSILADDKMTVQGGELQGRDVLIRAAHLLLESLQDTHQSAGHSENIAIAAEDNPSAQISRQAAHSKWVNRPSFISAERNLDLFVDYLSQKGAVLSAKQKLAVKGLSGDKPLQWIHEDLQNSDTSESTTFNLGWHGKQDTFPLTGFLHHRNTRKTGVTRATVAALDLAGEIPAKINRDSARVQEMTSDTRHSVGVPIVAVNQQKLEKDWQHISAMFASNNQGPAPKVPIKDKLIRKTQDDFALELNNKKAAKQTQDEKINFILQEVKALLLAQGGQVDDARLRVIVVQEFKKYNSRESLILLGEQLCQHDLAFRMYAYQRIAHAQNKNQNDADQYQPVMAQVLIPAAMGLLGLIYIIGHKVAARGAQNNQTFSLPSRNDDFEDWSNPEVQQGSERFLDSWMAFKEKTKDAYKNLGRESGVSVSGTPDPSQDPFNPDKDKIDRVVNCSGYGKFYHLVDKDLWVTKERATVGHGGFMWKLYKQEGRFFKHQYDADAFLNRINKHKSETGKIIDGRKECHGVSGWRGF